MKRTPLKRKTPLRSVAAKPKRGSEIVCIVKGCKRRPTYFPKCFQHAVKEADDLFATYIKTKYAVCQNCGSPDNPQCAHIVSRRYYALRWDVSEGAVRLCAGCHVSFTNHPLAWDFWCEDRFGIEGYRAIKLRGYRGGMPDIPYVIAELRTMLKEVS